MMCMLENRLLLILLLLRVLAYTCSYEREDFVEACFADQLQLMMATPTFGLGVRC